MACEAPFEPKGYIVCAASPSSAARPKIRCDSGSKLADWRTAERIVGTDQQIGLDRVGSAAAIGDPHARAGLHRHKAAHTLAGSHRRLAHSRHHRIKEDLLQPPAMNRVLRPVPSNRPATLARRWSPGR